MSKHTRIQKQVDAKKSDEAVKPTAEQSGTKKDGSQQEESQKSADISVKSNELRSDWLTSAGNY